MEQAKTETLPKIKTSKRPLKHHHLQSSTDAKFERYRQDHWNGRFHVAHMKEYHDNPKLTIIQKLSLLDPEFKTVTRRVLDKSTKPAKSYRNSHAGRLSSEDSDEEESKPNTEPTVFQLKLSLKKSWEEAGVPECHRVPFLKALEFCKIKRAKRYLLKQMVQVEGKKSYVFTLLRSINARENCIAKLLDSLSKSTDPTYEKLDERAQVLLRDYAELNIFLIESILKWRSEHEKRLKRDKMHKYNLPFELNGVNYLVKLMEDARRVNKLLHQPEDDTFLLGLNLTPLTKARACEVVLLEEIMHHPQPPSSEAA